MHQVASQIKVLFVSLNEREVTTDLLGTIESSMRTKNVVYG